LPTLLPLQKKGFPLKLGCGFVTERNIFSKRKICHKKKLINKI